MIEFSQKELEETTYLFNLGSESKKSIYTNNQGAWEKEDLL
jgi:hypothetical protein